MTGHTAIRADLLIATATGHATKSLESTAAERGSYLVERDLKNAMTRGIESQRVDVQHERHYELPHWSPQPGGVDLSVPLESGRAALIELKWANDNKIFEALWDAVKLADAEQLPEIEGAYLCYGASEHWWSKPAEGAEVFGAGDVPIVHLIRRYQDWWDRYILADSTGRPQSSPESLTVTPVSDLTLQIHGQPWRLRTVRLRSARARARFAGGLPG